MKQYRGSVKNFFKHNAYKSKIKRGVAKPHPILNLKKKRLCFSKQITREPIYLKKINMRFIKISIYLLRMLFVDFIILIKQKCIKKNCFLYKHLVKNTQGFSKNTDVFIKNTIYIILPQHNLKQQQK